MPKRSWLEANSVSPNSQPSGSPNIPPSPYHARSLAQDGRQQSPSQGASAAASPIKVHKFICKASTTHRSGGANGSAEPGQRKIPSISRKVKACAACRKQKVGFSLRFKQSNYLTCSADQVPDGSWRLSSLPAMSGEGLIMSSEQEFANIDV